MKKENSSQDAIFLLDFLHSHSANYFTTYLAMAGYSVEIIVHFNFI